MTKEIAMTRILDTFRDDENPLAEAARRRWLAASFAAMAIAATVGALFGLALTA